MFFGKGQDRVLLFKAERKKAVRGTMKRIDHAHVRWWLVLVVSIQLGIFGVMVLEGQFHVSSVPDDQSDPKNNAEISNLLSRTRRWPKEMSRKQNVTNSKSSKVTNPYQYKEWIDDLLRIPVSSLHFHDKDGSPLGISADYGVAVKMFKEDRKIAEDAVNEMQLQAAVKNPNIIRFLGTVRNSSIEADKRIPAGFIMEYFPGTQLEVILDELSTRSLPPIPLAARCKIALDIANSLAYLHTINTIHFDVKPEQLLIRGFPPDYGPVSARLIDFGMALHHENGVDHVDAQLENGRRYRGTQHYLAPELVVDERNVTEMVDVYSFGVVLWEMYTREYPYRGYKLEDVMKRIRERKPIGLKLPKDCEEDWKSLVKDCMQWNPQDRPTFSELSQRLVHMLDNILLEETNGKNSSDSIWLQSEFDAQDVERKDNTSWDMVGVVEDVHTAVGNDQVILINHQETNEGAEATALCPGSGTPEDESVKSVLLNTYPLEVDDLKLGKQLGAGIYGEVYLSNMTVRTKMYKEVNSKALREVHILSKLQHPNILHLVGAIVNGTMVKDGKSLPLISGIVTEDLGSNAVALEHTSSKTTLSSKAIGAIASQLASALEHAHLHGLVLISLSPQNVMIHMERHGGVPIAKITDVRLAECSIGDWQYNKEVKPGSHGYIAPEVLAGKRPSGKSDVFSLGKIMKFMCRDGRAPSPAPVGCSSKWRALVAQCLLMDPADRPDPLTVFMRIQSMGGQLLAGSDN